MENYIDFFLAISGSIVIIYLSCLLLLLTFSVTFLHTLVFRTHLFTKKTIDEEIILCITSCLFVTIILYCMVSLYYTVSFLYVSRSMIKCILINQPFAINKQRIYSNSLIMDER